LIARLGAKRTMLISDAARGPLLTVLPVLYWTHHLSFPAILAATFAVGCFTAPYFASSRIVIPEVAGEDERAVTEVGAVLAGANQLTQIAGPVLAGVLIAATSAAAVLVVDAGTYVFSFLTILTVVRAGGRVEQTPESKGLLAGLRFLGRDRLLGPLLVAACALNFVAMGVIIGVQGLAYSVYHRDAHVVGFLFGGFGAGALLGALTAQQLASRADLLKMAAVAILGMPIPIYFLAISMPAAAATFVVGCFGFTAPLVNAPIIGILTVRTPQALRPKVMTAVMTVASLAGPLGFVGAGEALRVVSLHTLFLIVAVSLTVASFFFAAVLLRGRGSPDPSVPEPAI